MLSDKILCIERHKDRHMHVATRVDNYIYLCYTHYTVDCNDYCPLLPTQSIKPRFSNFHHEKPFRLMHNTR